MKNLKRRTGSILILLALFLVSVSCEHNSITEHKLPNAGDEAPGVPSDIRVENIPGGAHIFYLLPKGKDLLYVEADYIRNGKDYKVRSTKYSDSLTVRGFDNTDSRTIKLFGVSRGGVKTEVAAEATIKPKRPIYKNVFESIEMDKTFGGVKVTYAGNNNISKQPNMSITVLKDSMGNISTLDTKYIKNKNGQFVIRGLENREYKFGYYIRSKFQNYSDTVFKKVTPLYETRVDPNLISPVKSLNKKFEDFRKGSFMGMISLPLHSNQGIVSGYPATFTFDLGQMVKLNRIELAGQPNYRQYIKGYPKNFELWGSSTTNPEPDNGDQFSESWTKLALFEGKTPSGTDSPTQEEINEPFPANIQHFAIPNPEEKPYIRLLRIRVLRVWQPASGHVDISLLNFYGQPEE